MRAIHIAFGLFGGMALISVVSLGGCSADGTNTSGETPEMPQAPAQSNEPTPSYGNNNGTPGGNDKADAGKGRDATAARDSSTNDASRRDSSFVRDTGPDVNLVQDADPQGTACSTPGDTQRQACGFCGYQERVCLGDADGSPAVWQVWGFCQQAADACEPGTNVNMTGNNYGPA